VRAKPAAAKGRYIRRITLTTSMGPGIRIDPAKTRGIVEELEEVLDAGGGLFFRLQREMEESGVAAYPPGPWHAGLEEFPGTGG
jgi:hypothetical protein